MAYQDQFGAKRTLQTRAGTVSIFDVNALERQGTGAVSRLPFSIKVMLESLLRNTNGYDVLREDVINLARWQPAPGEINVPLKLARVILQDFTGVPAVVDLAALRSAMARAGADPKRINPVVPVDLVIDHSVQVDFFGTSYAYMMNVEREYERNRERYSLLKWAQNSIQNFRVVPPGAGIVHQVNLEYLGKVVMTLKQGNEVFAFPDSLVGTDSHTTMINGLGILGWGVGGIEAEAVMLDQPYYMLAPEVVGFKLTGRLPEGATATDLVLTVTEMLRKFGVVNKFVEFYGPGLTGLPVADRATIANMSPEYGATMGYFPIDEETLAYLRLSGRDPGLVDLVERYAKEVGIFRTDATPEPIFSQKLELDMSTVVPSLAGPKRPQDRVPLTQVKASFESHLTKKPADRGFGLAESEVARAVTVERGGDEFELKHGSVVIAAITSCTNTSNPSVMIGAGILAKKAVERGIEVKPWVKTSMAPGSKVVTDYLEKAGLTPFLHAQKFHTVGFGCTTCIGNSGPLPDEIAAAVEEGDLVATAVLSGNRNFEGRVNPHVKANYLASPVLVVAYALAGRIDIDFASEPLGHDPNGQPVYLRDVWPTQHEVQEAVTKSLDPSMFEEEYGRIFEGDERWKALEASTGDLYEWDPGSTYIQEPPFFQDFPLDPPPVQSIRGARALALLGDSITTDHISPAGNIAAKSPAGEYLMAHGVEPRDFNSYGARRGAHEVMMRGTFANIRLKNFMLGGDEEGPFTVKLPEDRRTTIYDASIEYQRQGVPLVVIGGKEYGSGSSRDWAAKGPFLLGVKAAIAESFERIHRSNLVGMGVLPLQFKDGESARTLGLTGFETYDVQGLEDGLTPGREIEVVAHKPDGSEVRFATTARIDTQVEVDYYANGGILQTVLRRLIKESKG
jgi:aconitate hydratase